MQQRDQVPFASSGTPCPLAHFLRVLRLRDIFPLCTAHSLKRKVTLFHSAQIHKFQKPAVGDGKIQALALTPLQSFLIGSFSPAQKLQPLMGALGWRGKGEAPHRRDQLCGLRRTLRPTYSNVHSPSGWASSFCSLSPPPLPSQGCRVVQLNSEGRGSL